MPVEQIPVGAQIGTGAEPFNLWKYSVNDYTELLTIAAPEAGDIAKVKNSQGTKWLPGSLGGTYYPSGFYEYSGTQWEMDKTTEELAQQFVNSIADINDLESTRLQSVVQGTNITVDNTDPLNPVINAAGGGTGTLFGLYSQTAQSSVINTAPEQSIVGTGVGSLSVPANSFTVGDAYHAKIGGKINATGGGGRSEIIVRVKAGSTILATTGIFDLDNATDQGWELELDFTIQAIGASGSINTNGNFCYTKDGNRQVFGYIFQDTQAIDTTINNTLDITVEWNNINAGDDIYSANFVLFKTY